MVKEAQEVRERRVKQLIEKKAAEKEVKELKVKQRRLKGDIEEQSREKAALQQRMDDLVMM